MNLGVILIGGLWAGLFSAGLGVLLTGPHRHIPNMFLCGFTGRVACDLLAGWGLSHAWSTVIASTLVVLVGSAALWQREASPVVLVTGILPLGASVSIFKSLVGLLRIPSLEGEALSEASVALIANVSKVFTSTLAIALGIAAGMAIVRLLARGGDLKGAATGGQ